MKPTVIDPNTSTRAAAFDLWMNAPNPIIVPVYIVLGIYRIFELKKDSGKMR